MTWAAVGTSDIQVLFVGTAVGDWSVALGKVALADNPDRLANSIEYLGYLGRNALRPATRTRKKS